MIRALIFDLDGVIVDTAKYHFKAWKKVAKKLKIPFEEKENEKLKGISRINSLEIILNLGSIQLPAEEKNHWLELKNNWYLEHIKNMNPDDVLLGAEQLLTKSREEGYKIALGSASKNAILILKKINLINAFDKIIDGNLVTISKPNPKVFLEGAKLLEIPPEECIVFEDAQAGIIAAKRGGMKCVGVGSRDNLKGANVIIKSLEEVVDINTFISDHLS